MLKVSQEPGLPVEKPLAAQYWRILAEPWVQLSGCTRPLEASWIRSSPTAAAASMTRFRSSWVTLPMMPDGSLVALLNQAPA